MRRQKADMSGFTLIEIMLTIALVTIIMAIFYGILHSTMEAEQIIIDTIESSEIGPTILNVIKQDLEGAFLPKPDVEYFIGQDKKTMGGDGDRLDFVSETIAYGKENKEQEEAKLISVNEIGYQVKENEKDAGLYILYRREQFYIDDKPLTGGTLQELYDRVKSFNLEYYDGEKWVLEWNNTKNGNILPQAVKIELVISILPRRTGYEQGAKEQAFSTIITLR